MHNIIIIILYKNVFLYSQSVLLRYVWYVDQCYGVPSAFQLFWIVFGTHRTRRSHQMASESLRNTPFWVFWIGLSTIFPMISASWATHFLDIPESKKTFLYQGECQICAGLSRGGSPPRGAVAYPAEVFASAFHAVITSDRANWSISENHLCCLNH